MLVLLDRDWGGRSRPPRQKFSVTSVGVIFNQWGLDPQPPTNRTLPVNRQFWVPRFTGRDPTFGREFFCIWLNSEHVAKFGSVQLRVNTLAMIVTVGHSTALRNIKDKVRVHQIFAVWKSVLHSWASHFILRIGLFAVSHTYMTKTLENGQFLNPMFCGKEPFKF